jgi:hypothetical protein
MQPAAINIRDLAIHDPVAAYGILLQIPRIPMNFNAQAIFSSFAVPQTPITGALDEVVGSRFWVQDVKYSVLQPNVFAGNINKSLYDANLRQAPGVSVRVATYAGPRYLNAPNFTPLENYADTLISLFPTGWPIYKIQSIKVEFSLTQAPPSLSPNAPPYIVTLTYRGWQFLDHTLDECSPDYAANVLRKAGFDVPCVSGLEIAGS